MILAAIPLLAGCFMVPNNRRTVLHDRLARTVVVDAPDARDTRAPQAQQAAPRRWVKGAAWLVGAVALVSLRLTLGRLAPVDRPLGEANPQLQRQVGTDWSRAGVGFDRAQVRARARASRARIARTISIRPSGTLSEKNTFSIPSSRSSYNVSSSDSSQCWSAAAPASVSS